MSLPVGGAEDSFVVKLLLDTTQFLSDAKAAFSGVKQEAALSTEELKKLEESMKGGELARHLEVLQSSMKQLGMGAQETLELLATSGKIGKDAIDAMTLAWQINKTGSAEAGVAAVDAGKGAAAAAKTATAATITWGTALKAIGKIVGITSILSLFTKFVGFMREATEVAMNFSMANYRLQVAVRAAQREYGAAAGSMEEWVGFVMKLRKQFGIFSTLDLTAATAKVILLTRELGFTKERMMEVTEASIILAEVSGRDVEDAARRLALFLDTGYARGLAQLGVQVSKSSVEQYALAHGIEKTYNEMSRQERAILGLNTVLEQTARLANDAGEAQYTLRGQLLALKAAQVDAMVAIGRTAGPVFIAWERAKTFFITDVVPAFIKGFIFVEKGLAGLLLVVSYAVTLMAVYFARAREDGALWFLHIKENMDAAAEAARSSARIVVEEMNKIIEAEGELGNVPGYEGFAGPEMDADDETKAIADAFEKLSKTVKDMSDQLDEDIEDAGINLAQAFDDLLTDLSREIIDAQTELNRDLNDIDIDFNRKRSDLISDAAQEELDVVADNRDRIAEAQAEYRLKEIQAQREFTLEMAQLERRYLFDLEDAVRERDARGVLSLMRKHNIEVAERTEDFAEQRRQAAENLALEIAQIKAAEARKRAEIRKALAQRLADLEVERLRAKADRAKQYAEELEDIYLKNERERQDAQLNYDRQLEDLHRHYQNRLKLIGQGIMAEYNLTFEGAVAIYEMLAQFYDNIGGLAEGMVSGVLSAVDQAYSAINNATIPSQLHEQGQGGPGGYAEGGGMIARKPTTAMFGEAGAEMATFIPLDKMQDFFSNMGGFGGNRSGRISLDVNIRADDKLIAEVVDKTLSDVAEVIISSGKI